MSERTARNPTEEGGRMCRNANPRTMTGYVACVHVLYGAPPSYVEHPTGPGPRRSGILLCRACEVRGEDPKPGDARVVCAVCARRSILARIQ